MPKLLKTIFVSIGLLALLLLLVIGLSSWLVSPNDFKPQITAAVKSKIGRELTIDGDVQLSVFPWLAITADKVSLANAPGFESQPFAKLAQVNASLKLLSLLSKQIEVKQILVKDLELNLTTNPQGVNNWSDLLRSQTAVDQTALPAQKTSTAKTLAIEGINIENAHVYWDDQKAGNQANIQTLNLKTGQFAFNTPVTSDLSFTVINKHHLVTKTIKLNGDVVVNENFGAIGLLKPIAKIEIAGDKFPNKQLPISITAGSLQFNQQQQVIKISGLLANVAELQASSDLDISHLNQTPNLKGQISIAAFNPKAALTAFGIAVPVLQDKQALTSMAINASLQANTNGLELQNLTAKLDDSTLTGNFSLKNFAQPALQFKLAVDQINADRYLSAETKQTAKSLVSPAVTIAAAASALPKETLRKLDANGDILLNKLTVNNLTMQDLHLTIEAKNGTVKTSQAAQHFYQGDYAGNMSMNINDKQPVLSVNEKINRVQLQPMLQDMHHDAKISGLIDATSNLNAQGNTAKELTSSLNGSVHFLIKDSVIYGFNLQNLIDQGKSLIQNKQLPAANKNAQTMFSQLSGNINLSKGVLQNNDLQGVSAKVQVAGKGSADLNTQQLDYKINAKFADAAAAKQAPSLTINVTGPFAQPNYQLDVAAVITDKNATNVIENVVDHNKDKIDKLLNKLDKKTGQKALDLLKKIF